MTRPDVSPHSCPSSSSLEGRDSPGAGPRSSSPLDPRRGNIIRRIEDSLVGDVIGAVSLVITLIGLLILGLGLS